jgi:hypothetical protein
MVSLIKLKVISCSRVLLNKLGKREDPWIFVYNEKKIGIYKLLSRVNLFIEKLKKARIPTVIVNFYPYEQDEVSIKMEGSSEKDRIKKRHYAITLENIRIEDDRIYCRIRLTTWVYSNMSKVYYREKYGRNRKGFGEIVYRIKGVDLNSVPQILEKSYNKLRESYNELPALS